MTGVDEDFLRRFANSERGLDAATEAETVYGAVTVFFLETVEMLGRTEGERWEAGSVK
jgi:hypothetical protein